MGNNNKFFAIMAGLLTAVVLLAYVSAVVVAQQDIVAKDWLGFFGALIGLGLTPAVAKFVDWLLGQAEARRRTKDYALAVRAFALTLEKFTTAQGHELPMLCKGLKSMAWLMTVTGSKLPDVDFDHRVKMQIMSDAIEETLPDLTQQADAAGVYPHVHLAARRTAANLAKTVLAVAALFDHI